MNKKNIESFDIVVNTIRLEASHRGGGIEIDVSSIFGNGKKMTAYQNYLGGGMLGSIGNSYNWNAEGKEYKYMQLLAKRLAKHFHTITNPDEDEWKSAKLEELQRRAISAY